MIWPNGDAFSVLLASFLSGGIPCKLVMHNSVVGPGAKTGWRFRLYWLWERYFLRKLALRGGLLTPSAQIREEFQKNHGITLDESHVIPIGFNDRDIPNARPFQSRVLVLGVITSRKNYPCAIEGFLAQKGLQELLIAGVLQDERIAGLIREKDAEGRIRLIDRYIQEEELEGLFESADVVLLPHGLGSTLASGTLSRALEFGVPIIGPKEGYIADWVTRYEIGSLFRPDDATSLATVLQEVGSNYPALYERFKSGYEHLSEERSWKTIAEKYL
jgi:glycosyltransferase involved in cell wall biosynthesis